MAGEGPKKRKPGFGKRGVSPAAPRDMLKETRESGASAFSFEEIMHFVANTDDHFKAPPGARVEGLAFAALRDNLLKIGGMLAQIRHIDNDPTAHGEKKERDIKSLVDHINRTLRLGSTQ